MKIIGPYGMNFVFYDSSIMDKAISPIGEIDSRTTIVRSEFGIFIKNNDMGTMHYMGNSIDAFLKLNLAHMKYVEECDENVFNLHTWSEKLSLVDGRAFCDDSFWLDIRDMLEIDVKINKGSG